MGSDANNPGSPRNEPVHLILHFGSKIWMWEKLVVFVSYSPETCPSLKRWRLWSAAPHIQVRYDASTLAELNLSFLAVRAHASAGEKFYSMYSVRIRSRRVKNCVSPVPRSGAISSPTPRLGGPFTEGHFNSPLLPFFVPTDASLSFDSSGS